MKYYTRSLLTFKMGTVGSAISLVSPLCLTGTNPVVFPFRPDWGRKGEERGREWGYGSGEE